MQKTTVCVCIRCATVVGECLLNRTASGNYEQLPATIKMHVFVYYGGFPTCLLPLMHDLFVISQFAVSR